MGQSRNEDILENMLGAQNPLGEPQSREEALLMQILEQGGGGGSSTLAGLTDVSVVSPSNGEVLKYDSTSQKWVNSTGGVHYSFDERVIGTWVDGSTLYEKTVYHAGGVTGLVTIPHNITNMSKCIDVFGTCYDIGYKEGDQRIGAGDLPLPRIATDNNNIGIAGVNKTNITVSVGNIWSDRITDFYLTLRYTKT